MILLIDNYDSFVYNLYQLIGAYRQDITVVRSREITVEEIRAMDPEAIFLSPGPGRPEDSGVCLNVIRDKSIRSSVCALAIRPSATSTEVPSPMPGS